MIVSNVFLNCESQLGFAEEYHPIQMFDLLLECFSVEFSEQLVRKSGDKSSFEAFKVAIWAHFYS